MLLSIFYRNEKFVQLKTNFLTWIQLVYKVKLDFVLEQLDSASVGGCGQEVWSELVEEARNNLTKIAVSVTMRHLQITKPSPLNCRGVMSAKSFVLVG